MRKLLAIVGGLGASLLTVESLAAGALAIDSGQGSRWGWAVNHETQAEADARALRECGPGCTIVGRFNDTCMAHASDQNAGSTAYGYAYAASASEASTSALGFCRQRGGANSNCVIRVWGCDSLDPDPVETPDGADAPATAVDADTHGRRGIEQVGEGTGLSPERACKQARDATNGYALPTEYVVINDSGCSCSREVKPDWDSGRPGWACRVRVLYDRRGTVTDRELRVAAGTSSSREYACQAVDSSTLSMEVALKQRSGSNWDGGRRDSGCYCPVERYEPLASGPHEWYCERIVRYYR